MAPAAVVAGGTGAAGMSTGTMFGLAGAQAGGSLLSGAMDLGGGLLQQSKSYKYAKKLYKHRYQWARSDLEAAGLNPMLAFGGSMPMPSMPATPDILEGFSSSARQIGERAKELVQFRLSAEQMAAQTDLLRAQASQIRKGWPGRIIGTEPIDWFSERIRELGQSAARQGVFGGKSGEFDAISEAVQKAVRGVVDSPAGQAVRRHLFRAEEGSRFNAPKLPARRGALFGRPRYR